MCDCCCTDPFSGPTPPTASVSYVSGSVSPTYSAACDEPAGLVAGDLLLVGLSLWGDTAAQGDLTSYGLSLVSRVANTWAAKATVNEVWSMIWSGSVGPFTPTITGSPSDWSITCDAFRDGVISGFAASSSDQAGINNNPISSVPFPEGSYCYMSLSSWDGTEQVTGTLSISQFLAPNKDSTSWTSNSMKDETGVIAMLPPSDAYDTFAGTVVVIEPA